MMPILPPRQREVFSAVVTWPGLSTCQIARRLRVPQPTVQQALVALERHGLIRTRRNEDARYAYPVPRLNP